MFWGITLENGKKYTQTVKAGFHVSMAALEPQTGGDKNQSVSLMLEHEKAEFLICSLNANKNQQQSLSLEFTQGEDITFFLNGKGVVHLTGFLTGDDTDDEGESDEDNAPQLVPLKSKDKKRKSDAKDSPQKRMKASSDSDDDDEDDSDFFKDVSPDDSDDSDDESEDMVVDAKAKKPNKQQAAVKAPGTPSKVNLNQKGPKPGQQQPGGKKDKQKQGPAPTQTPTKEVNGTGDQDQSGKKKKKRKKNKKNKEGGDSSVSSPQTPASPQKKQTPSPALTNKTLPSGVIIQDTQTGSGPEAKPGRFVHVYYEGRLHKDNKQFDSTTSGKPFKFRLGKGEVIKGWEDGLQGMKVGGKRKLVIPAAQAYGSKQMGPIPANSTLIFDVELKAVS
jgi:FK506-binding nuclear protein